MDDAFQVIAAFLDGERVDPRALNEALAQPAGRRYLIELVALRGVLDAGEASVRPMPRSAPRPIRWAMAAALVVVSLATGFGVGRALTGPAVTDAQAAAPEPNRVIDLTPGVDWHETKGGE